MLTLPSRVTPSIARAVCSHTGATRWHSSLPSWYTCTSHGLLLFSTVLAKFCGVSVVVSELIGSGWEDPNPPNFPPVSQPPLPAAPGAAPAR